MTACCRRHGALGHRDGACSPRLTLDDAAALAAAADEADARAEVAFARGNPWPTVDVVRKLADAADHLMRDHDCDAHGWELVSTAAKLGRERVDGLSTVSDDVPALATAVRALARQLAEVTAERDELQTRADDYWTQYSSAADERDAARRELARVKRERDELLGADCSRKDIV